MRLMLALPSTASLVPTVFAGPRSGWRHIKVIAAQFVAVLAMRLSLADFVMFPKAGKVGANKRIFLENLFNRLSSPLAAINDERVHFQLHSPLGNRKRFALVGQECTGSPVVGLFGLSSPAAISRFIVAAIVAALDGVAIRARAHVLKEVSEVTPSRANNYSARSVIRKTLVVGVITSGSHTGPYPVRPSAVHSMFVAHPAIMITA